MFRLARRQSEKVTRQEGGELSLFLSLQPLFRDETFFKQGRIFERRKKVSPIWPVASHLEAGGRSSGKKTSPNQTDFSMADRLVRLTIARRDRRFNRRSDSPARKTMRR